MKFKRTFPLFCMVILMTLPLMVSPQDQTVKDNEMMKKWQAYSTPGKSHGYLAAKEGTWEGVVKHWYKPGGEAVVSKALATNTMILGGRYLKTEHSGELMGMPINGVNIQCYDNYKKEFATLWIDDMGTGFYLTHGNLDASGNVLTEEGLWDDFLTGKKVKIKTVSTPVSANSFRFETYAEGPDGQYYRSMEIVYKKKTQ